jgi:uncharacterized membrane protein
MNASSNGGGWPLDILAIVVIAVAGASVSLEPNTGLAGSPLHVFLGILFVFVVPGAALTAALFPKTSREITNTGPRLNVTHRLVTRGRITTAERVVLSLGLSVAVVPLVGLLLNFTPQGVQLGTAIPAIAGLSLALAGIGLIRRLRLPRNDRFGVTLAPVMDATAWVTRPDAEADRIVNVVLVVGLVLAATGVAYAVVAPQPGERFTAFYLQTRDPETGELVADNYPSEVGPDGETTLYVGLTNQEHRTVSYTVVVYLQRIETRNGSPTLLLRKEVDRFSTTVEHNESWQREHTVTPTLYGEDRRLTYLLYKGQPPDAPTTDNAYRTVHIWVDVNR